MNYRMEAMCYSSDLEDALQETKGRSFDIADLFHADADNLVWLCWDKDTLEDCHIEFEEAEARDDKADMDEIYDRIVVLEYLADVMPSNVHEMGVEIFN